VRLPKPVSPHLAAHWAGQRIDLAKLRGLVEFDDHVTTWIVEGAGGLLVPVNETQTMVDWIAYLALPVLVVARSGLGTINHTLLTLEALHARSLRVAGVMMIGEPNADNRAAIEKYGHVPVVGEMPFLTPLDPGLLAAWSVTHLDAEFLR
jgi:dethiobiotin synthetase